ncbi:rup1p [Saccharomyces arboricola H-6]|uniref:Rup1p n=1 Tax=Saccharomyces arboricola (strain H-6 / AS 2.3317 / CBS 10644) TaxID=1160507 RepID=J8LI18_SACAR|nr:rup1p [Saccharomyces arboricola H-6]
MMDNQAVKSLLEMGIPHEVALDALQRTGGNLEAAVNFIFSNELPEQLGVGGERGIDQPRICENRPYDVPNNGEQDVDMADVAGGGGDDDDDDDEDEDEDEDEDITADRSESSPEARSYDHYSVSETSIPPPTYSIVQHNEFKSAMDDPTVILPLPLNSLIESYFGLFALLTSVYFPNVFLKPDFRDLNYKPDWFKGSSLTDPKYRLAYREADDGSTTSEIVLASGPSEDLQPHLLWQLQRLISVVNTQMCERAFVSAKLFTLSLEPQLKSKLADSEHLYEVLPTFIKSLAVDLEMCPGVRERETRNLFISSALHTPNKNEPPMETFLSLFHFLPEEYDSNLYKMFNVLLYPEEEEDDEEGEVRSGGPGQEEEYADPENTLKEVAPVLTILFNELETNTDSVTLPNGIDMPLEFYPQLYTKRCKDQLMRHIISKRKQARTRSRSLLQEISNLKSYQGKNVSTILESTLAYLQATPNDANNKASGKIASLKDTLDSMRSAKMGEYKDLASKLHGEWNLSHPEFHIIKTAKQLGLIENPYILTMAALSPYSYFIRDRSGVWSWIQSSTLGTEFKIKKCSSPSVVQEAIKYGTKYASETPLMFIYCEEGKIPTEEKVSKALENNTGCVKFAKDDQDSLSTLRAHFNDSTGNINSSTDQSINNIGKNNDNDNEKNFDSDN